MPKNDYDLEIWKRLWASRDFELSHFWQRSIFLTAFLVLIYTAYGTFQISALEKIKDINDILKALNIDKQCLFVAYSIISVFLCLIGIAMSILWIMLAKGSKNAYEAAEEALSKIDEIFNDKKATALKKANVKLDILGNSFCIFSLKAARYSVSKINIFLGILSLLIFGLLGIAHIGGLCCVNVAMALVCIAFSIAIICAMYIISHQLKGKDR